MELTRKNETLCIPVKFPTYKTIWTTLVLSTSVAAGRGANSPSRVVKYLSNQPPPLDVVVVAHQDDWQLFMGDVIAGRVRAGHRVVFIYMTAGDYGREPLYWNTRERGALESTRVALGLAATDSAAACSEVRSLGHTIRKCTIANTDSYFLRLPDGRRSGAGFALHSFASLRKLRGKRIKSITAVDSSAAYRSWADLASTVNELIDADPHNGILTLHTSDPNIAVNPHDHFDHRMAGLLVAELRRNNKWNVEYYAGYALASRSANRSSNQARLKYALFIAYEKVMTKANPTWSAYREHPTFYSDCMVRTYARSVISR